MEGNEAKDGGGLFNKGTTIADRTTFAHNVAADKGRAIDNNGLLTLLNSTNPVDTSSEGLFSFTVTATDNPGNVTIDSVTYSVMFEEPQ